MSQVNKYGCIAALIMILGMVVTAGAQEVPVRRCATMDVLKNELQKNPALKDSFDKEVLHIQQVVSNKLNNPTLREEATTVYIPVVFHVVLPDPTIVTDVMIANQVKVLNADYA